MKTTNHSVLSVLFMPSLPDNNSLYFSLSVRYKISRPHKTAGKIGSIYLSIRSLDSRREGKRF